MIHNLLHETSADSGARLSKDSKVVVDRFLDAIWAERGLSENTLKAYRADLLALNQRLEGRKVDLVRVTRAALLEYISWRVDGGAKPRSTARQLSSFRRFFRYLLREGVIAEDPTTQIAMPKIGRTLPQSLTEEEVCLLYTSPSPRD